MLNLYDIAWHALLLAAAPACGFSPRARAKVRKALRLRLGHDIPTAPDSAGPCVMIHAVSLGEINATRSLVAALSKARPDLRFLVTVTTDTGYEQGQKLYGANPSVTLVRYPLDVSSAIRRLLDRQRPAVVVLMELEVWPNFTWHCERRGIPVLLINGRLTESSFRNYHRAGPIVSRMFRRLAKVCAQDADYAKRFEALGVPADRVQVTGTMKFDTSAVTDRIAGDAELAAAVGLRWGEDRVWVCGSTGTGEEAAVLRAYRALLAQHPNLRLVIVPRHPERFDAVADLIRSAGFPLVRRSAGSTGATAPGAVILGDTMGELRKSYSLADVVFVGRSLVDLGQRQRGSDMIEPAALGKPVVIGPWTQNFSDAVRQLREGNGVRIVESAQALPETIAALLEDPADAAAMGRRAQAVVRSQQGATARHAEMIIEHLSPANREPGVRASATP